MSVGYDIKMSPIADFWIVSKYVYFHLNKTRFSSLLF